jgi:membrane protease YdiL (CAAX protease family)
MPETPRDALVYFGIVCPTAGITEEVLFRGFAITRLEPLVGDPWAAAVVAAIAFAFGHSYQGVIGIASTALIGLGYAASYIILGTLVPAMVAHALHNALSAVLFKLTLTERA